MDASRKAPATPPPPQVPKLCRMRTRRWREQPGGYGGGGEERPGEKRKQKKDKKKGSQKRDFKELGGGVGDQGISQHRMPPMQKLALVFA